MLRTSRLFFNGCILIPVLRTSIYKYSRCYAPCKGFDQMGRLRSGNLFSVLRTYSDYGHLASGYYRSQLHGGGNSTFKNSKLAKPLTASGHKVAASSKIYLFPVLHTFTLPCEVLGILTLWYILIHCGTL